ncbi:hypothetical protein [Fructilactobacillus florum]|uniref:hypothetical protein n=1 Tax=Fructilactobacillus florum TaxID=640331 RepID=UPI000AE394AE|nr:hypothetical protein [Fructilactobacillus florum]
MKRKQQHHWVRRILKDLLITILLLIGLGLVFNSQLQSWWISHQSQQKVEKNLSCRGETGAATTR